MTIWRTQRSAESAMTCRAGGHQGSTNSTKSDREVRRTCTLSHARTPFTHGYKEPPTAQYMELQNNHTLPHSRTQPHKATKTRTLTRTILVILTGPTLTLITVWRRRTGATPATKGSNLLPIVSDSCASSQTQAAQRRSQCEWTHHHRPRQHSDHRSVSGRRWPSQVLADQ